MKFLSLNNATIFIKICEGIPSLYGKWEEKKWKQWQIIFLGSKITVEGDCSHEIKRYFIHRRTSLVAQRVKHLPAIRETWVRSLGWEDPLEKEMATHSSTLAWKIPWTEKPGRLQSMGSQRVRHDWATSLSLYPQRKCYDKSRQLEKVLESPLDFKEIKPVNPKGNQPWIFIGRNDAEAEVLVLWPPDTKSLLTG